jgi:hypothetical protein
MLAFPSLFVNFFAIHWLFIPACLFSTFFWIPALVIQSWAITFPTLVLTEAFGSDAAASCMALARTFLAASSHGARKGIAEATCRGILVMTSRVE